MSTVIEAIGLTKIYGSVPSVKNIDLQVHEGEIVGFVGPNGAGKTTTLRMIMGEIKPTQGLIKVFSHNPFTSSSVHEEIGYLTGDMALNPSLTGEQYLRFMASLYPKHESHMRGLVNRLHAELHRPIKQLSRGNKQKIALVAAFMHQPRLLVFDEPSSGFDPLIQQEFAALVLEHREKGGAAIISSHILTEVQHLCDRVAFIGKGELVKVASMQQLLQGGGKRVRVVSSKDIGKKLAKLKGVSSLEVTGEMYTFAYEGDVNALLHFLSQNTVQDISIYESQLESEFQSMYAGGRS